MHKSGKQKEGSDLGQISILCNIASLYANRRIRSAPLDCHCDNNLIINIYI